MPVTYKPTNVINSPFMWYSGISAYNIYMKVDTLGGSFSAKFSRREKFFSSVQFPEPQSSSRNSFEFPDPPSFSRRRFSCQAWSFAVAFLYLGVSCKIEKHFLLTSLHLKTADLCHAD